MTGWVRGKLAAALAGIALAWSGAAAAAAPVREPIRVQAPIASKDEALAPRPAIWLLQDEDTKIYLFGTNHVLPEGFRWRSEAVERVIRESAELVMEIAEDEVSSDEAMLESRFMGKSVPLLWRVSPQYRPRLQLIMAASGLPEDYFNALHTWAAGFVVMAVQAMAMYGDEEGQLPELTGVEDILTEEFRRAGKPISAVETSRQQMDMFRTLPRNAQQAFLESLLGAPEDEEEEAEAPVSGEQAWVSGRLDLLAREAETMPPELYEALLTRRNRAWTDWLEQRLEQPGTVLFAVGALHLAGPDSVQNMLAARGLQTQRID